MKSDFDSVARLPNKTLLREKIILDLASLASVAWVIHVFVNLESFGEVVLIADSLSYPHALFTVLTKFSLGAINT